MTTAADVTRPSPREDRRSAERSLRTVSIVGGLAAIGGVLLLAGVVMAALTPPEPVGVTPRSLQRAVADLFHPDLEGNIWAWYSAMVSLALGTVFGLHAVARRATGHAWVPYVVLAVTAVYLSADEAAHLHEELRHLAPEGLSRLGWVALGLPLAAVAGAVLLVVARALDSTLRRRLIVAGVVFLAGAAGMELVAYATRAREEIPGLYLAMMAVEEGMELAGALIALWAALAALLFRAGPAGLLVAPAPGTAADVPRRP